MAAYFKMLIQAMAADVLIAALIRLEEAGIPVVGHIHDEIIADAKELRVDARYYEYKSRVATAWLDGN